MGDCHRRGWEGAEACRTVPLENWDSVSTTGEEDLSGPDPSAHIHLLHHKIFQNI